MWILSIKTVFGKPLYCTTRISILATLDFDELLFLKWEILKKGSLERHYVKWKKWCMIYAEKGIACLIVNKEYITITFKNGFKGIS